MRWGTAIAAAVVLLAALGTLRVLGNVRAMERPPPACQMLGGSWDWWSGWRCA